MKKISFLVVLNFLLFMLSACGGGSSVESSVESSNTQNKEPIITEEPIITDTILEEKFIKISASGIELPDNSTEWSCVKDKITGNIWEVKTNDNMRDLYQAKINVGYYNQRDTAEMYASYINNANLCGYSDWRIPSIKELNSIVDRGNIIPFETKYFPNIPVDSEIEFLASEEANSSDSSLAMTTNLGELVTDWQTSSYYVILVRGNKFFDDIIYNKLDLQGNELPDEATTWSCVIDKKNKLIWEVKTVENYTDKFTFSTASDHASNMNAKSLCGYNNWRVPSIDELIGLADYFSYPRIKNLYFTNMINDAYWSSSFYSISTNYSTSRYWWSFSYQTGNTYTQSQNNLQPVILVANATNY